MQKKFEGDLLNENVRIGIIISKFNEPIIENLLKGVLKAFENNGIVDESIEIFFVPGAFEIPPVLKRLCRENLDRKKFDGFVTVGCIIKGETAHFEYICESVSKSINTISYEYEIPVGFCILTCYTPQQANERSRIPPDADNNKGYEAALVVLEMISLMRKI